MGLCEYRGPHPAFTSRHPGGSSNVARSRAKKDGARRRTAPQRGERGPREAWSEGQLELDPTRIVFIDETAANTKMARLYGRAPRGERCRDAEIGDDHIPALH